MTDERNKKEKKNFEKLQELLRENAKCFNDGQTGYAEINFGDHFENHEIRSRTFKQFFLLKFSDIYEQVPCASDLSNLMEYADAKAMMLPCKRQVFRRIGSLNGNIYIDLGDQTFKAVEIRPGSWDVIDNPPVGFIRSKSMLPLPYPERYGAVDELYKIININDEHFFIILFSWLVTALNPNIPCPTLLITGEQGAAKSSGTRILHSLIDPSETVLRPMPSNEENLFVGAQHSWVISCDNVSGCGGNMSDSFCRLVTGAAYTSRQLYTNSEESVLKARRPVIINGINSMASKPDLVSRIVNVELPPITGKERISEQSLQNLFAYHQPRIMGSLYDAVAWALQYKDKINLAWRPRMADYAQWATAAGNNIGWNNDTFLNAYRLNMERTAGGILDDDVLAQAVTDLMTDRPKWTGYAKDLLETLNRFPTVDNDMKHDSQWPANATALSRHLNRIADPLRNIRGIDYRNSRDAGGAKINIRNTNTGNSNFDQTPEDSGPGNDSELEFKE